MRRRRKKANSKGKNTPKVKRDTPYNIPSTDEIEKLEKSLKANLKRLNPDGSPKKLLTLSQVLGMCRGAIREKWGYAATKLAYLEMGVVPDLDPNTRRRWKVQCERCGKWFKKDEIQVDHIKGEHSLKEETDLYNFYIDTCDVPFSGLQRLDAECHEIKTAMERYGYNEEEVVIFKKVTAWEKAYIKVADAKEVLTLLGYNEEEMNNKETRRKSIWNHFENGGTEDEANLSSYQSSDSEGEEVLQ